MFSFAFFFSLLCNLVVVLSPDKRVYKGLPVSDGLVGMCVGIVLIANGCGRAQPLMDCTIQTVGPGLCKKASQAFACE